MVMRVGSEDTTKQEKNRVGGGGGGGSKRWSRRVKDQEGQKGSWL